MARLTAAPHLGLLAKGHGRIPGLQAHHEPQLPGCEVAERFPARSQMHPMGLYNNQRLHGYTQSTMGERH